ncbi:hypothetical protein LOAG_08537 [Loa loa]|uniref:Thrombospondin type 1 domain-containing protein n=1 Tax=Loa loa TaxID=7209 RepID=A0A1S0TV75_LOALO|nr:hypothetical protein LOAG_08537 [Loa loa]EFO19954.2 hypothetical protein LOAG_08537 [Loa loa]
MVIGLAGVTGACVQAIVVLLVIKSEAECVLIHYLLIEVHTVPVSHTINDLAYQEGPALEYQLTESGHRGLNGHSAPILVTMVISLEQGSLLLKFCSNPRPSEGGMQCVGSDFEIMSCNDTSRCLHSQDGAWTEWNSWSTCTSTCGFAYQLRQRYCGMPYPQGTGKPCVGIAYMSNMCKTDFCKDSIDGMWSEWGEWSSCIADCKNALKIRNRTCESPKPINGGYPCFGRSFETKLCQQEESKNSCSNSMRNIHLIEMKSMLIDR